MRERDIFSPHQFNADELGIGERLTLNSDPFMRWPPSENWFGVNGEVKMSLMLYKLNASPPARTAMMVCELFKVPVKMVDVNLSKGEHFSPEYLKRNPLHTVPTLEDGDLIITDSHAIAMYLADKYGKDDSLYPKDLKSRAIVNQRLFFDSTVLFSRMRSVTVPVIIEGCKTVTEKQINDIIEAYGYVETYLSNTKFIATNNLTIADISAYAVVSSLLFIVPLDGAKFPKTQTWLNEMEKKPFAQKYNVNGVAELGALLKEKLGS